MKIQFLFPSGFNFLELQVYTLSTDGALLGLNANTFSAHDIEEELGRSVVLVDGLAALGLADHVEVLFKQVRAVHGTTLGLGVELGREDGSGLVHHAWRGLLALRIFAGMRDSV